MKVELIDYEDNWQAVKNAAMNTMGKDSGKYPTEMWKRKILHAEHSPIRLLEYTVRMDDIPYWVSVHLVRHKYGVEHFVSTQRTDRTGVERGNLPQNALVTHTMRINAQSLINVSRRRLCACASPETREVWQKVVEAVGEYDPEVARACVKECVYRGYCPELKPCGFSTTGAFEEDVKRYRDVSCRCENCYWNDGGVCMNAFSDEFAQDIANEFKCGFWEGK